MRWKTRRLFARSIIVPVKLALLSGALAYLYGRITEFERRLRSIEAAPRTPPWTVVAMQQRYGPKGAFFGIEYLAPTGVVVRWEREIPSGVPVDPVDILRCWSSARVGERLPECAFETGYADVNQLLV